MCWRRGLKVNSGKSKVLLNRDEVLEYEAYVDGMQLEHVWEFKYLGCVLNESGTDKADCYRKVAIGKRVACVIRPLANAWGLRLDCGSVLHKLLLMPVLSMVVRQ